jgi:hypothetical protein
MMVTRVAAPRAVGSVVAGHAPEIGVAASPLDPQESAMIHRPRGGDDRSMSLALIAVLTTASLSAAALLLAYGLTHR